MLTSFILSKPFTFFFLCYTYCDNFLNIRIIIEFYISCSTCKHLYYQLNDSMMFEITFDNRRNVKYKILLLLISNIISTILTTVYIYLLNCALEHVCLCTERLINVV